MLRDGSELSQANYLVIDDDGGGGGAYIVACKTLYIFFDFDHTLPKNC